MTTRPTDTAVDSDMVDLSNSVISFPDAAHTAIPPTGGSRAASVAEEDRSYFFPLPYNDDQIEIVRRLEQNDVSGVVVQAPPGHRQDAYYREYRCPLYGNRAARPGVGARTRGAVGHSEQTTGIDTRSGHIGHP
jgi:hypothetical protein